MLQNLDKLVVKAVGESGGYGMLIGPQSTEGAAGGVCGEDQGGPAELYCAADDLIFSRAPCLIGDELEPRHVDLRPYVLYGDKVTIVPGGLDAGGAEEGIAGGEFQSGRRE